MRLALYQPDIPQNCGTILRMAACFQVSVDIIEPCGFIFDDRRLRRSGMDYLDQVDFVKHQSWESFLGARGTCRLVLATTRASVPLPTFSFSADDIIVLGRESAGVPETVADQCDAKIRIPMAPECRSLNVALSAAIILGEAMRQTNSFPDEGFS
jgi:tRNA (cytidine/uridine-2'-O-)-methyltransferase